MKYGQTFQAQSVPQWAPYNVDYNELKTLIKIHTTKDQAQAIAIPGQEGTALAKFEDLFFKELYSQHDRVDLFVKSKADEIGRRLQFFQKAILRLLARCTYSNGKPMSRKRREKFARYDNQVTRCGEEIRSLQRFVDAQRMAFRKILKKYKKWTGSRTLGDRFEQEVLNNPKSFTRRDFEPLLREYNNILAHLRASTPDTSEPTSPIPRSRSRSRSPRPRAQRPAPQLERQSYWNEYDDGSEAENEPYTIYVNPGTESTFSGPSRLASLFSKVTAPMEQVRAWLNPSSSGAERRPLLGTSSSFTEQTETDVDDASSSDFPSGYAAHYATFPSINDQKFSRSRERLLFHSTIASFAAALVLVLVAGLLVATGRHKLRVEVDAGAIVGVVSSLFFATLGFGTMLYRTERLSWLHRICVICTFVGLCVLNGLLLVIVVGNTGL